MRFLSVLLLSLVSFTVFAQSTAPLVPAPPALAARSWLLIDWQSRQVLAERNADERMEPASLTKLMTAYLVFDAIKQKRLTLTQTVPVSMQAYKAEGSRMFIDPKQPVTVDELLRGMIVQSGNDATIALAEAVAGSEGSFADLMNKQAARMGLANSHFMNASGLPDPQHYSTARDLATLAANVIRDFPEFFPLYSIREYTYNKIRQGNRNRLLGSDPTVDGMKTGFHKTAGYCLIATALRPPRRLLSVVLGTDSEDARAQESQKLLNWGFQFNDTVRLYEKGAPVGTIPVYKGSRDVLNAGFTDDLYLSVPSGMASRLTATFESQQPLVAPVTAGQRVGVLKVTMDGKPVADYPVVALESIGVASFFGRTWDSLRLLLK
ncbi:MAG: D-alanyl-D-alanine carboxypeptidase [Burkholderiales bacterium]|nr:D-alanyl-D-alanine carboxypeptidase [Burkholderiales bacterium]